MTRIVLYSVKYLLMLGLCMLLLSLNLYPATGDQEYKRRTGERIFYQFVRRGWPMSYHDDSEKYVQFREIMEEKVEQLRTEFQPRKAMRVTNWLALVVNVAFLLILLALIQIFFAFIFYCQRSVEENELVSSNS